MQLRPRRQALTSSFNVVSESLLNVMLDLLLEIALDASDVVILEPIMVSFHHVEALSRS